MGIEPEVGDITTTVNQCWPINFTHDQLLGDRSYRLCGATDGFNRYELCIEAGPPLPTWSKKLESFIDELVI